MKTATILSTLAFSALLATAANAQQIIYSSASAPVPVQVFQTAPIPQIQIQIPATAAGASQPVVQAAKANAATPPAAPAPASPIQVHGQNVTVTVDAPAPQPQILYQATQPTIVAGHIAPQFAQPMMPATYQPFPPDTQRAVNCLIASGGNYVGCGINEALSHVYAELAKCVNGVNVARGCFAPKRIARTRR